MTTTEKLQSLTLLICLALTLFKPASSHWDTCRENLDNADIGISLLQVGSKRTSDLTKEPKPGIAGEELPAHLYELGLHVLGSEQVLDAVVANTVLKTETYSGEEMKFRIPLRTGVDPEDGYDLDSLGEMATSNSTMVNMVDIGGNLGRVTMAAFKKHSQKMRIVAVEPVPSTYFLMRWNLWLNDIPQLSLSEFQSSPLTAGVVALQNGIADVDEKTSGLCYTPPFTMTARMCNCSTHKVIGIPEDGVEQCFPMIGKTIDYFLNIFGDDPVAFLKMDCEGCETDLIPSLMKRPQESKQQILTFAGELHAATNELEDFACKFEGGRRFVHVCFVEHDRRGPGYQVLSLSDRCHQGTDRESCRPPKDTPSNSTANLFEHAYLG